MTDLAKTIAPKSDQLNADDLIAGPRTITITGVRGCDEPDQPIAVNFEGDDRKPYKPCKSMRRVMVHCWGPDGNTYAGRRMTLYCDPNVQFGGIKVGGIRISHMSHIDREMVLPLTVTRAKRTPYTVKPLRADVRPGPQSPRQEERRPDPREADERQQDRQQADSRPADDDFPGDRPTNSGFDVIAWAEKLEADLPDYAGVDVLRLDWNEHKDELKAKDIDLFRRVNLAVAKRAEEIGKGAAG